MRAIAILIGLVIFMALCFNVAAMLSPDAVGMAVGMLFGVLAGIPTALLMMAGNRRRYDDDDEPSTAITKYSHQPPVVIVYPPAQQQYDPRAGWPTQIPPEDAHLYTYDLSAYGDAPRRVALPSNDEQRRLRRRVNAGMVAKVTDDGSEPPAGFRHVERVNGRFEELDEPWMR